MIDAIMHISEVTDAKDEVKCSALSHAPNLNGARAGLKSVKVS